MTARFACALAVAATFVASGAEAASVDRFTSLWVLGDSLSDPGNLFRATGGETPASPPYFEGRFSNGPVWAEHVADRFRARDHATGNVAFGGARALGGTPVPDLTEQIGLTALGSAGRLGERPVATVWFGANDLLGAIGERGARRVARRSARAVAAGVDALADIGIDNSLVFNLPDLGRTPNYNLFQPELARRASRVTRVFNRTLDRRIDALNADGLNVREVDVFARFNELLDDPGAFGIEDTVRPCLFPPEAGGSVCSPSEALVRAFFDPVHPNSVLHGEVAALVDTKVAPLGGTRVAAVPLPGAGALLLAALALGAGLGSARRAARTALFRRI